MFLSIQPKNVFQPPLNPFAGNMAEDKGGGAVGLELEGFYKGKIGIFHFREFDFFPFPFSSYFPSSPLKPCAKDISTEGKWGKNQMRLSPHL